MVSAPIELTVHDNTKSYYLRKSACYEYSVSSPHNLLATLWESEMQHFPFTLLLPIPIIMPSIYDSKNNPLVVEYRYTSKYQVKDVRELFKICVLERL